MLIYSWEETAWMVLAAIVLDWLIGDPRWPTHPVIRIGQLIRLLERWLRSNENRTAAGKPGKHAGRAAGGEKEQTGDDKGGLNNGDGRLHGGDGPMHDGDGPLHGRDSPLRGRDGPLHGGDRPGGIGAAHSAISPRSLRLRGVLLTFATVTVSFAVIFAIVWICSRIHPWLGYAANIWFISTTIAVKGLKDAAMQVYRPLEAGELEEARTYAGYIVGRDTAGLEEPEIVRAAVETVAENTVDAFVSPIVFALLGGAPLAMLYRAANTLDSMVGYKNEKYRDFGWASARFDDVLNYVPARISGFAIAFVCLFSRKLSARRAIAAVYRFASLHPSPNSGIPESAVAGALGIELGGTNRYGSIVSERAKMGWPLREKNRSDIVLTARICYGVSYLTAGGLLCAIAIAATL
jgi:adenosylcobinamide-phosphate synthase